MTTANDEREARAEVPVPLAHVRACRVEGDSAEIIALAPSLPSPAPGPALAERVRARIEALAGLRDKLAGQPGTLPDAQPPTFRQAYDRHRECAGYLSSPVLQRLRRGYGHWHVVLIKAPLNYAEWATCSPLGLFIHVLLGLAVWLALLAGSYL